MAVPFPALPWTSQASPRLVRYGSDLSPALGGPVSRINRLGSRFAVDISLPTLDRDVGPLWVAALLQAEATNETNTLVMPSAYYEAAGGATVAQANQAGSALSVAGLSAGGTIPALIPFSFFIGGRNYLHMTTQGVTADGGGNAILQIAPMLRVSPTGGANLNFEGPVIEGYASGTSIEWQIKLARYHEIKFTLTENA